MKVTVQIVRAVIPPQQGTALSAGIDFFVPSDVAPHVLRPGQSSVISSGCIVKLPEGTALVAFNKSSMAVLGLQVGACVVDEDYQGEVHLNVRNISHEPIQILPDMKLVQFLVLPVVNPDIELTEDPIYAVESERGTGAFGSTGTQGNETPA